MLTVYFGKAKVSIVHRGCLDCGTEVSSGWHEGETVHVTVQNKKPFIVVLYRCEDCQRKLKGRNRHAENETRIQRLRSPQAD